MLLLKQVLQQYSKYLQTINTFLYVFSGSVKVGEDEKQLNQDQVGWLDLLEDAAK